LDSLLFLFLAKLSVWDSKDKTFGTDTKNKLKNVSIGSIQNENCILPAQGGVAEILIAPSDQIAADHPVPFC
jgi:hypothetical protein